MRAKFLTIILLFSSVASAQLLDFNLWVSGARSVEQGRMAILAAGSRNVTGKASTVQATLANLPPNSKGYIIWNITRFPNTARVTLTGSLGIKIKTTAETPIGSYDVLLTYSAKATDNTAVERTLSIPFVVRERVGELTKLPPPPDTPIPALKQWERNMKDYGGIQASKDHPGCCGSFTGPWYYDGARAFLQIADYTGESRFLEFAHHINNAYRDNALITKGSRKYAVFPHGLALFYKRFGDEASREALKALQADAGYGYRVHWGAPWSSSREMAYGLSVHLIAESVGLPRREERSLGFEPGETSFDETLAVVLGHFEQWFISETARFVYPFMVGLSAEALIDYYEVSKDPIVPSLLKLAADKMYLEPKTWDEQSQSMMIVEDHKGKIVRAPAPDLNLMIAPLYGWVFQQTGDPKYRDIGDKLFAAGVQKAYLDGGKQFTQNYRWSFKYVEWRRPRDGARSRLPRRR